MLPPHSLLEREGEARGKRRERRRTEERGETERRQGETERREERGDREERQRGERERERERESLYLVFPSSVSHRSISTEIFFSVITSFLGRICSRGTP